MSPPGNARLDRLQAYPFERLTRLKAGLTPPRALTPIAMSVGEPRHTPPAFIVDKLRENSSLLDSYPSTAGMPELRAAAARWLERRFALPSRSVDPQTMVLAVNGTREALFSFVQAMVNEAGEPLVALPNPCYQIYEGAALLAGAEPFFLDTPDASGQAPDLNAVPEAIWRRCQILFLCSPGNPTGTVLGADFLRHALELAERYDFIVAADECYSEIYLDERTPPPGLLPSAFAAGHRRFERCIVFHSLSKRSSVPGLRSGFVAGDPAVMARYLSYRTYHGCVMPVPAQLASIAAWDDEQHVAVNRHLYQEKFDRVVPILARLWRLERPAGAFYLWPDVGADDEQFTRELFARTHISVLPGSYLARAHGSRPNPGSGHIRISLVPSVEQCVEAAERIRGFVASHR